MKQQTLAMAADKSFDTIARLPMRSAATMKQQTPSTRNAYRGLRSTHMENHIRAIDWDARREVPARGALHIMKERDRRRRFKRAELHRDIRAGKESGASSIWDVAVIKQKAMAAYLKGKRARAPLR